MTQENDTSRNGGTLSPIQPDELRLPQGSIIFRQGDPGHEMFVISHGQVRLTLSVEGNEKEIAVLKTGDFFGELSLMSGAPRTATAEALEDCVLLAIGRDAFGLMMQDDLEIVFRMMDIQGQRLVEADRRLERLARSLVRVRVVAHCLARVLSAEGRLPLGLEARSIAAELGLTAAAVNETITSVAESGVGTMRNGYWHFDDPAHIGKLTALLCRYASER